MIADPRIAGTRLLVGHVLDRLRELPDASIHCCVTSPPYWGLRNYGTEPQVWGGDAECEHEWINLEISLSSGQQEFNSSTLTGSKKQRGESTKNTRCARCAAWRGSLGLEPTPQLYVQHLVEIFREVRRVLRDDGTLWLNLGDSYNGAGRLGHGTRQGYKQETNRASAHKQDYFRPNAVDLKPKDLVGIPWRVAFALQEDGWYLRSEIIWHKPAPMPESVTDRPTKSHEHVFLLSKRPTYFYDLETVKEPAITAGDTRHLRTDLRKQVDPFCNDGESRQRTGNPTGIMRQQRDVWTLAPSPNKDLHFATFPPELPRRCILAGTSAKGVCSTCGAPWVRIVERKSMVIDRSERTHEFGHTRPSGTILEWNEAKTVDWKPTCKCVDAGEPIPATVLDPFFGSGTTGVVCRDLWRSCIGIDLNDNYSQIAERRMPEGLLHSTTIEKGEF